MATLKSAVRPPRPADVAELLASRPGPRVSIYLEGPSEPGFAQLKELPLRFRLALDEARRRIAGLVGSEETDALLREAIAPPDMDAGALPRHDWSLAAFFGPGLGRVYSLPGRTGDVLHADRRFELLPLLRAMQDDCSYRVLTLSRGHARLYEGRASGLAPVETDAVPDGLDDALFPREPRPDSSQAHGSAEGNRQNVHGSGGASDERANDLERYHHAVAKAVARFWSKRRDPLVLVADRAHQGRFHKAAQIPGLLERGVDRAPEKLAPHELHAASWPLVQEELRRERDALATDAGRLRRERRLAEGAGPARKAADQGLVRRLFVADDFLAAHPPGTPARERLEELAELVLGQGGEILFASRASFSEGESLAAELRAAAH